MYAQYAFKQCLCENGKITNFYKKNVKTTFIAIIHFFLIIRQLFEGLQGNLSFRTSRSIQALALVSFIRSLSYSVLINDIVKPNVNIKVLEPHSLLKI